MATNFEVNLSRLNSDITTAKHSLDYMKKNIKKMFDEINQLDAMWDGNANEAFNAQFKADYNMMLEVCANLEKLIASMEFSKQEYTKCENSVASAVKAMRI